MYYTCFSVQISSINISNQATNALIVESHRNTNEGVSLTKQKGGDQGRKSPSLSEFHFRANDMHLLTYSAKNKKK